MAKKGSKKPLSERKKILPKPHTPSVRGGKTKLNIRQERFAHHYVACGDAGEAYVLAGYEPTTTASACRAGNRLLTVVMVADLIDKLQRQAMDKLDINRDDTLSRFKIVYLSAMADRDFSNALRALENIGKYLGLYERDNEQKRYTVADIDKLRAELEMAGFNFKIAAFEPTEEKRVEVSANVLPPHSNGAVHVPPQPPQSSDHA